ncbi:polysaccharide deacetylase family protein [Ponticaulis sp.]|uniref:polysaccharide deacetylase family protein n=1 Tax=Ponticaulis sp. TaxID=2020902 RepID=UPI00261A6278|nr:polysaccharide deacetylase family protein [Ponticaulis sp.]MDF1681791.1 polysaccharide deacetylase family protein [Ponticaulis sp.]
MLAPKPYEPNRSLFAKIERRLTQYRKAAPATVITDRPILSITFDDCPTSAAETGARILEEYGVRGGYYIATGLMGRDSHMGLVSTPDQIAELFAAGHEIGAHSHSHLDCSQAKHDEVMADVERNIELLKEICHTFSVDSFAYPYGETRFDVKKHLAGDFLTLRGILPGINRGMVDRAQLRAFEIDHTQHSFDRAYSALHCLKQTSGWMIIFTHDVAESPSQHGMTPDQLRRILDRAEELDIEICTPKVAAERVGFSVS